MKLWKSTRLGPPSTVIGCALMADLGGVAGRAVEADPFLRVALAANQRSLAEAEVAVVLLVDREADRQPAPIGWARQEAEARHMRVVEERLVVVRLLERLGPGPGISREPCVA